MSIVGSYGLWVLRRLRSFIFRLNGGISETPHGFPPLQSSPLCLPLALTESLDEIRIDELIYVQVQLAIHE